MSQVTYEGGPKNYRKLNVARELEVVTRCPARLREPIQYSSSPPRGVNLVWLLLLLWLFSKFLLGSSAIFMMADNKEQRVCVKFCFLWGKSAAETVLMLQEAFKEEARICVATPKYFPNKRQNRIYIRSDRLTKQEMRSGHYYRHLPRSTDKNFQPLIRTFYPHLQGRGTEDGGSKSHLKKKTVEFISTWRNSSHNRNLHNYRQEDLESRKLNQ